VIGILGGLLIGIGLIFVIVFIKRRKDKKKQIQNANSAVTLNEVSSKQTNQIEDINQSPIVVIPQNLSGSLQVSFNEIVVEKELGEGSYGKVCLGKWRAAAVALKFCKNKGKLEEFINEMKLMIELPPHPNVVQLFGVSLDGPQPVIVMEYCARGSLDKLLFDSNAKLSDEYKMRLIRGIALGMFHLHKHNVVHRDLAARNILLTGNDEPKISDFGMSRIVEKTGEGKTKTNIGPIRWMAPESIAQQIYSPKSDVWSFGIVVYEIVARREPHTDVNPLEVGLFIRDQYLTPKIPVQCPPVLRELMQLCWQTDPNKRPSFKEICQMLRTRD
jgi:serine/threonine protein kinase